MANANDAAANNIAATVFGELKHNWGWLMALGILFLILGIVGLGMTFAVTVVSVLFFGVLLLIGGAAQLVEAFKCKGWKSVLWQVLIAVLYIIAGISVVNNPVGASAMLTLVLAWIIIVTGIMRIIIAFQHRGTAGWVWGLIGGVISVILGMMILNSWPVSGLYFIGLFVAIEMIINGWSTIAIALAAKNAPDLPAEAEAA